MSSLWPGMQVFFCRDNDGEPCIFPRDQSKLKGWDRFQDRSTIAHVAFIQKINGRWDSVCAYAICDGKQEVWKMFGSGYHGIRKGGWGLFILERTNVDTDTGMCLKPIKLEEKGDEHSGYAGESGESGESGERYWLIDRDDHEVIATNLTFEELQFKAQEYLSCIDDPQRFIHCSSCLFIIPESKLQAFDISCTLNINLKLADL